MWIAASATSSSARRGATWKRRAAATRRDLRIDIKRVSIRDQSSRWGSCSNTGVLSFSWRLILAPSYVLDYLAAHEVAHLKELNHSPRFWRLVGTARRGLRARQDLARCPRHRPAPLLPRPPGPPWPAAGWHQGDVTEAEVGPGVSTALASRMPVNRLPIDDALRAADPDWVHFWGQKTGSLPV